MPKAILGYWDHRGLAEPIRYLLHYSKVDFVDKRYTADVAGYEEWQKDKFGLGLDFPDLPYYIEGDFSLTQSITIISYLGYRNGLVAKTTEQHRRTIMAEQQSVVFRQNLKYFVEGDEYGKIGREEFLKRVQPMFQEWEISWE
ncbi:Glutathione S-transferase [Araneus ventricosus]|uniref:glutathione transferase n=1 Tax=Araneus ventricosus TaxID=182803 RepID=A0A4Y2S885_ARAVE|nr:Glutathione S-transferase [Araneus ventricosus]